MWQVHIHNIYHIYDFDFIELSQLSAQFNMYGKLFLDKEWTILYITLHQSNNSLVM